MRSQSDKNISDANTELRSRAENKLKEITSAVDFPRTDDESQRLVHEMQVHQIELDMQNSELIQSRDELETALDNYSDIYDFAPVGYFTLNRNGAINALNLTGASLLGEDRARLLGRFFVTFVSVDYRSIFTAFLDAVFSSQDKKKCEVMCMGKESFPLVVQIEAMSSASTQECRLAVIDLTDRRQAEEKQSNTIEILRLCNNAYSTQDLLRGLTCLFQKITGCESVGVRLRTGNDYPYYETLGFTRDFIQAENNLCTYDQAGEPVCNSSGLPVLDCMCGNILSGKFDPSKSFFTSKGSFWSSSFTELLANMSDADRQPISRNSCLKAGYESIALIPINYLGDSIGLFQCNDRHKGRFNTEKISILEDLIDYLPVTLAKLRSDEALMQIEKRYSALFANKISAIAHCRVIVDEKGRPDDYLILQINETYERIIGIKKSDIEGRRVKEVFPGVENYSFDYIGVFGQIALEGGETVVDAFLEATQQYLSIYAYSPLPGEFTVIMTDVTERKQAEAKLKQSESDLAIAQAISHIGSWRLTFDEKGEHCSGSAELNRIYGYAQDTQLTMQTVIDSIHPEDLDHVNASRLAAIQGAGPLEWEHRIIVDGQIKWLNERVKYIFNDDGSMREATGVTQDISERKLTEEKLRDANQLVANLLENMSDSFVICDSDWRYTYINAAAECMLGYRRMDMLGRDMRSLLPNAPDDTQRVQYERAMAERISVGFEMYFPLLTTWVDVRAYPMADGGLSIFFRNITERKELEQALREKEERFRTLANSAPVLIWTSGTNKLCTWFNQVWLDFTGRSMEQEIGNGWAEGVHPDDFEHCLETYTASFDNREPFSMEYRLRCFDGQYRWVLDSGIPLYDQDIFSGYVGSCIDITNIKQAEESLQNSEERYRQLFEMDSDTVLMLDMDSGLYIDANSAAVGMYGYSKEEFMRLRPVDLSIDPSATEKSIQNKETYVSLCLQRKKDGTTFPVEITSSYYEYNGREVHVAAIRDITERQRTYKQLSSLNQRLSDMNEHLLMVLEQERLAISRDIHDDLGQNLTVLKLDLEMFEHRIPADSRDLKQIAANMRISIDQIVSKIQQIAAELRPPLLDNLGLSAAIGWQVNEIKKRSGPEFFLMLNEDADSLDQNTSTVVMRIVQEGLTNIVRHAHATEVSISLCQRAGNLILEISDNGCGITPEQISSSKAYGLMGMRERARSCRGVLEIIGNPEGGTTLSLSIPLETGEGTV